MKKNFLLIFGLLFSLYSIAQNYGNEWINFNQEYYKIKVLENGFHKVSYQQLLDIGFPVDEVNPQEFQLWYRGEQMAIEVHGEQDGSFNTTDNLVFYGQIADASLETPLYINPEFQQHTSYSLYSDTSYYYLTWQESIKGKRIQQLEEITSSNLVNKVTATQEIIYSDEYAAGEQDVDLVFKAEFDNGEGWVSPRFGLNRSSPNNNFKTIVFTGLSGAIKELNSGTLELGLVGLNDRLHRVEIQVGNSITQKYTVPDFESYVNQDVSISLNGQTIVNDSLVIKISCFGGGEYNDYIGLSFVRLTYQKQLTNVNQPLEKYYVNSVGQKIEVLRKN